MERTVFFTVDLDSTATLLRFWGIEGAEAHLDRFYDVAMGRALDLFRKRKIAATFFCVGDELDKSSAARHRVRQAFEEGHEIANHTFTHPYGLSGLSKESIRREIADCSDRIFAVTGRRPSGFRSPSYDMSQKLMEIVREFPFLYDSSASWNLLQPLMKVYYRWFSKKKFSEEFGQGSCRIPREPYFPSREDWRVPARAPSSLLEIPLPRSPHFHLPFYNNFHLQAGPLARRFSVGGMREPTLVYLIHLIELVDESDGVPRALRVHPTVRMSWQKKVLALEGTLDQLCKTYRPMRMDRFAESLVRP